MDSIESPQALATTVVKTFFINIEPSTTLSALTQCPSKNEYFIGTQGIMEIHSQIIFNHVII